MKILYHCLYSALYLLSLLPLWVLYRVSDFFYLLAYHVVGYRTKLERRPLPASFHDQTAHEIAAIERGFYHWFCDYMIETIKLMSMSRQQMMRRMQFKGTEQIDECVARGQSCGVYLGHYCNWEWITSLPLWVSPSGQCTQIYHVLENPWFDRLFVRLRSRFGSVSIPMAETLRRIAQYRKEGQPIVMGYISDQVPFWNNIHHWLDFLHHDTPVLTGTEKLMRGTGQAVFYADIRRPRRGYYECTMIPIEMHPEQTQEWQLTDTYFRLLETSIRRQPACYLWTHNRWKRTREEYNLRYDPETGRVNMTDSVEELRRKKGLDDPKS